MFGSFLALLGPSEDEAALDSAVDVDVSAKLINVCLAGVFGAATSSRLFSAPGTSLPAEISAVQKGTYFSVETTKNYTLSVNNYSTMHR